MIEGERNMPISDSIRYFNKRFTNKITGKLAGKKHSPFALIQHAGRKSGRHYATPIIALKRGNDFLFALTYGPQVDWYQNILASGSASIAYREEKYALETPTELDSVAGRKTFPQPLRFFLFLLKVTHFFKMHIRY